MVDVNGNYLIDKIGFNFSEIISPLLEGKPPVAKYYGIDWYASRMPLFPYFLYYMYYLYIDYAPTARVRL
jgi:hypothetical protein